jgi:hypothetical protein
MTSSSIPSGKYTDLYPARLTSGSGSPDSGQSDAEILNYRLYPIEDQTIFSPGPNLDYQLSGDGVDNYVAAGAGVSVPAQNLSFHFSGLRRTDGVVLESDTGTYEITNTMIKADMGTPGSANWSSIPLPDDIPGRAYAQVVWLPVSALGILLVIGGVIYPQDYYHYYLTEEQMQASQQQSPGFMTTIDIYDIETDRWMRQETEGTPPGQTMLFCAVAAGEAGDDHFDIFIYGGDNGLSIPSNQYAKDEVWVLSVPSFRWTKVSAGTSGHGRSGHVCSRPLPNQMLLLGGWNYNFDGFCIQDGSVIDVFDLNDLKWTKHYDPQSYENYTSHDSIARSPRTLNTGVQELFNTPYPGVVRQWYPYAKGPSSSSSTPIGAIAGAAAGGGLALLAIIFLIYYCRPSRRQARKERRRSGTVNSSTVIGRWRQGIGRPSTDMAEIPMPKDAASVTTTTEVDPQMSPPLAHEAYGDHYFYQRQPASPSPPGASPEPQASPGHSPRRVSYQSQPPRSPRTLSAQSIEADVYEVHEKDADPKASPMAQLGQGPVDFRRHPEYPYSIDRIARSENGSNSNSRHHLGSNISHNSRHNSYTAPSPHLSGSGSLHEVDNGQVDATEIGTGTMRPSMHQRVSSGISAELPLTPPIYERFAEEQAAEMQMRSTSGPMPLFEFNDNSHEDAVANRASAVSPLPEPESRTMSSEYDTITTVPGTETGDMSTANTLRGDALSPRSEKSREKLLVAPLRLGNSMGDVSSQLQDGTETEIGTMSSGYRTETMPLEFGSGTRKKPVVGRSAYEEDQRLRRGR